jgi:hypothetical protein
VNRQRTKRTHVHTSTWLTIIGLGVALLIISACGTSAPAATPLPPTATTAPSPTAEVTEPTPTATPEPEEAEPAAPEAPTETPQPLPTPTEEVTATPGPGEMWAPDGVISEGEYDQSLDFGDIRLWWTHDGAYLYLAMEGDTAGWVAVGINPELGMQGADYIFGYVTNGEALIWDAYGTAPTGANHPPDEELGGTNDIVDFIGVEENGITRFEVKKPLDSGDPYDQVLVPGNSYPIIVAIGGQDNFNAYHLRYDRGELTLAP